MTRTATAWIGAICLTVVAVWAAPRVRPLSLPGQPPAQGAQVRGVTSLHRAGQTFITWRELDAVPPADLTIADFAVRRRDLAEARRVRYRIYRADHPIARLSEATLVGEVQPLSAWNGDYHGASPPATAPVPRYVIEEGKAPLAPGTGLFVHNPARAGQAYYLVTAVVGGVENTVVAPENTTAVAIAESVGPGAPVLQRVEKPSQFVFVSNATLRFYVRWETPPNASIPGKAFDYLVAVPGDARTPATVGLHLHGWGGSMVDGFGWWFNAERGAVLVSSNENPYDWWTGYSDGAWKAPMTTAQEWQATVVRPYSQRRLLSFLDWLATTMKIDLTRTFVAGNSMGGSGAAMLAIRQPSRIAWAMSWVGVHVPAASPQYKSSYETVFGKPEWGVKFEDGTPVWDFYNDVWYLRNHQAQDIGLVTFSNGKNDSGIGWRQAADFFRALQETRQPHIFVWGQDGHGQRAIMPAGGGERSNPMDLRTNQSLPAFSRCSLDDDPGNGAESSGAPAGQVNAFLTWKTDNIIDEPTRWGINLGLIEGAKGNAVVDVTPRRTQAFKLKAGDRVEWTNTPAGAAPQRGEIIADQWGLVTAPQVQVPRGGTRLVMTVVR